jgi:hypothetical protein
MIVVIDTQYKENYGTETEPYWKFKGGSSYKVVGVPEGMDPAQVVVKLAAQIEYSGAFSEEYILGHSVEADGWLSEFEQSQLEYDGAIRFPEPTIEWKEAA